MIRAWTCPIDGQKLDWCDAECVWKKRGGKCLGAEIDDIEIDKARAAKLLRLNSSEIKELADIGAKRITALLRIWKYSERVNEVPIPDLGGILSHVSIGTCTLREILKGQLLADLLESTKLEVLLNISRADLNKLRNTLIYLD